MSALGRTYLLVGLFFAGVTLLCMAVLLRQAAHDVQRELDAAQGVVDALASGLGADPAAVLPRLERSLRHIRVDWVPPGGAAPEPLPRSWLDRQLYPHLAPARLVELTDGRTLRLAVDPRDEIDEVWDSLLQLLALFGLSLLACLAAMRWSVGRALRVMEELLAGLRKISQGQLDTRLVARRLPEARRLAGQFNAMAAALQHAEAENARLTRTLLELQERERTHLAQVLHDDLGQYVAGIRAQACLLGVQAERPEAVRDTARQLERHSQDLQNGFRALVHDLYPVMLEHLPLDAALRQLVEQWQASQGIDCRLELPDTLPPMTLARRVHLYRVLQEALTNVARHAGASRVRLWLRCRGDRLRLLLCDDGHGRPPSHAGVGLRSMRERARCLGGRLRLRHRPGAGWMLLLDVPGEARP